VADARHSASMTRQAVGLDNDRAGSYDRRTRGSPPAVNQGASGNCPRPCRNTTGGSYIRRLSLDAS
jgi:hypothetical protein